MDAADAFLAAPKTLDGPPPIWAQSEWGGECSAVWNMLDADGAPFGTLKFTAKTVDTSVSGANVIYRGNTLWRVDMDHDHVCHSNPHDGYLYGLDPLVCGSHEHAWPINRDYILRQDIWRLRYRRPLAARKLEQGLLWLASQINLTIEPDQRGFDGPTRRDLFDMGGMR